MPPPTAMLPRALTLAFVLSFVCTVTVSAAQYPPSYQWRTITTDHFEIHYHQGEEELARRAAAIAEAVHLRLVPVFEWEPRGRTQLILTDHVDVSNGSATPFPFNRMEVYVSAPGADPSTPLEHYDDWLNLVITHEYAHILHLDMARGYPRLLRRVFGRTPLAFPNMLSPLWLLEGIATLVESEATEAGRLKGTFVDMVLRTAAIEGRFASEPQAAGLTPSWPGGNKRYYYGSAFLAWLSRTQGRENLTRYLHDYAGSFFPYRVNASARAMYGENMSALWREWSREAQTEYRAEHARLTSHGLTERERLTQLGFETKYPMISPAGDLIAYAHRGEYEWPTLRVRDLGTNHDVASVRVNFISPLSWSPDGRWIAFSQLEVERSFSLLSDLYLWNPGSGEVRRLTSGSRLKSPAFTPDGRSLVAVGNEAGRNRLVLVDVESGETALLLEPPDLRQFSEPNVSPDGERIAVAEWQNGRIDVVLYDFDGNRLSNLSESLLQSTNASPRYSADGGTIWFSSDVTGVPNIFSVELSTGEIRRRTNLYGGGFFPSTADGRNIYYADYSASGFDLAHFPADAEWPLDERTVTRGISSGEVLGDPIAVPEPLEEVDDQPYSAWSTLRPHWWMPIAGGSSGGGRTEVLLGAYTLGSDALGFHQYDVQVMSRAVEENGQEWTGVDYAAIYSYDRLYPTLTLAARQYSDDTGVQILREGRDVRYHERIRRITAQAHFPYNRYRWQSSATLGVLQEQVRSDSPIGLTGDELDSIGLFQGTLRGARVAAAFNNARQFGYSISPENGITAAADFQALSGERSLQQLRTDLRGYYSLPVRRSPLGRHVAAARVSGGWTEGDFLLERELQAGGVGSGGFLTIDSTNLPVRGFSSGTLRGQNAILLSLEYRFPLYEIERGPSIWPIFFHRLSGDVFLDAATTWNADPVSLPAISRPKSSPWSGENTIASVGAEISLDLFAGYFIPLRYRAGAALVLATPPCPARSCGREGDVELYLAFGSSF